MISVTWLFVSCATWLLSLSDRTIGVMIVVVMFSAWTSMPLLAGEGLSSFSRCRLSVMGLFVLCGVVCVGGMVAP